MPQLTSTIPLQGGMDLVTPPVQIPAGKAIGGANYEPDVKGYRRIGGYERFDGRPKPSQARYWMLAFGAGTAAIAAREVVGGASLPVRVIQAKTTGPCGIVPVLEPDLVSFAEFTREVQAETGAGGLGSKKWLEHIGRTVFRDAGALIDHVEMAQPGFQVARALQAQ